MLFSYKKLQSFIEAKSSSPRPTKENAEKFDTFIKEIAEKFVHSFNMFLSSLLLRSPNEAMPESFKSIYAKEAKCNLILEISVI